MTKKVNWTITDRNVSVNYDGQTHIVPRADALADRLIKAVKEGKLSEIPALVDAAKRIEVYSKGNFVVKDGRVHVNGLAAPQVLSDKIIRFSNDGLPFQPLIKFAEKLQSNPSFRAVNELYQFLEKNDHPLTENGNFIAYKRVKSNFMDIYSGTFDNSPGKEPTVPRNQVDEDSNRTCSNGLHVANWYYAHTQFGSSVRDTDIMLEVEVDPSNVVAIPADYNQSKMRVCKYKVLGVVTTPFDEGTALRVVDPHYCGSCDDNGCENCEEEENDTCEYCGEEVYDAGRLCTECQYDEDSDEDDNEEDENSDRYPYEDEIEEE
jgi:hypothetical protein